MKLNQLDPHLAPETKLENPDIRWNTGIRDGELLTKELGSELPKKSHYPYLRIRDVFSDDVPKLRIGVHQLYFAQIKNDFK